MQKYYKATAMDARSSGPSERFVSDSSGAERGVPNQAPITRRARQTDPFDPPKYWDYFPGTD